MDITFIDILKFFLAVNILFFPGYVFLFFHFKFRKKYYTDKINLLQEAHNKKIDELIDEVEKSKKLFAVNAVSKLQKAMTAAEESGRVIKVTNNVHSLHEKKEMTESEITQEIDHLLDLLNSKKK